MLFTLMVIIFIIGYACIALEHPLKINKSATALLLGIVLWILGIQYLPETQNDLVHYLGEVAEILFFLMGAMTIVELIDVHDGFRVITDKIQTTKKSTLLWIISLITFFMSAVLDNLTTSIVMVALLRKIIGEKSDRWIFAGIVILAANAGGAWSPIGDVTTIMLWLGEKYDALHIILSTFIPSAVSLLIPVGIFSLTLKGNVTRPEMLEQNTHRYEITKCERNWIFFLGVGALLFVPIFKMITHLPPYLGILGGLALLWIVTGFMHKRRPESDSGFLSVNNMLSRIDLSSILFFLGILMAVNALQACGHLGMLSASLDKISLGEPNKYYLIVAVIGFVSSVIDNVPLVAAAMGMYDFPINHYFWEFLAYAAGTGGSILIIGSAAGVAVMGMEKIDFIWYLKKISGLAVLGYFAGLGAYILQQYLIQ